MKRIVIVMTTALALVLAIGIFAPTNLYANEINVTINGMTVDFEGQAPIIVDGRTLVPVRGVFEALGFDIGWNQDTQTATLRSANYEVVILVGSATFTTNGIDHALDVPAQIIVGRTMLPIRAVVESVGYDVNWCGITSTVLISTEPPAEWRDALEDLLVQFPSIFIEDYVYEEFIDWDNIFWRYADGSLVGDTIYSRPYPRTNALRVATSFRLYDLDGNGIPTLIIHFFDINTLGVSIVYRFVDGKYGEIEGYQFHRTHLEIDALGRFVTVHDGDVFGIIEFTEDSIIYEQVVDWWYYPVFQNDVRTRVQNLSDLENAVTTSVKQALIADN